MPTPAKSKRYSGVCFTVILASVVWIAFEPDSREIPLSSDFDSSSLNSANRKRFPLVSDELVNEGRDSKSENVEVLGRRLR